MIRSGLVLGGVSSLEVTSSGIGCSSPVYLSFCARRPRSRTPCQLGTVSAGRRSRPPRIVERLASARAQFIADNGGETWETAWAEGETLVLADAIAYARRARGPSGRPPVGWVSLTPAELEVAQLAADGSSNPEIAPHLFTARSTVRMHLSSVYLKLRIANRAQLAREMTMHTCSKW